MKEVAKAVVIGLMTAVLAKIVIDAMEQGKR